MAQLFAWLVLACLLGWQRTYLPPVLTRVVATMIRLNGNRKKKKRLLVVGQVPPPLHGQAMMIHHMLQGDYDSLELRHVSMTFSRDMKSVGKFQITKCLKLLPLVCWILYWRVRGYRNLYFPPASGNLIPMARDMFVLLCTRFFFASTIFHFHSADLTNAYSRLPMFLRPLFRLIYCNADLAVLVAKDSGIDLDLLQAKRAVVIPNAVPDQGATCRANRNGEPPIVLYVGAVRRSKGLMELLDSVDLLNRQQIPVRVEVVGEFQSEEFRECFQQRMKDLKIEGFIRLHGPVDCEARKREIYRRADVFCFPTYYVAETFGIVLIEAMSSGLPVVSTIWRSIPDTVREGENGLLVKPRDSVALARRVAQLLNDREMRIRMGASGRLRFEQEFTLKSFHDRCEKHFYEVCV